VPDEVGTRGGAVSRNDVDDTRGNSHLSSELGHPEHGQRCGWIGLEDHGAPGGQRGCELPRSHHDRVIPRHDLGGHADGLFQCVGEDRAPDRGRPA
jgi:hypothetical protein